MSYRNKCIAVVTLGVAGLVLGSWFLGEHAPNALVLLIGAVFLAIVATQSMLVAIVVMAHRRERARAEDTPR